MTAYYNEIDAYCADWLRLLMLDDVIAPGDVDTRDIQDVRPSDLAGYTQCHFFAGIGVWSYALRQAGWPDGRAAWTGSCPCQPFSAAGRRKGFADERHLWPAWHHLIRQRHPAVVFGEQVAGKDGLAWFDTVHADLEALDYACGAVPFPAAGVGAPHIRDRLYFVADTARVGSSAWVGVTRDDNGAREPERQGGAGVLVDTASARCEGLADRREPVHAQCPPAERAGGHAGSFWRAADWIWCLDNKARPVEPGTFPLAYGAPSRVRRLRAYGNAIAAPAAQAFIEAYLDGGCLRVGVFA